MSADEAVRSWKKPQDHQGETVVKMAEKPGKPSGALCSPSPALGATEPLKVLCATPTVLSFELFQYMKSKFP